MRAYVLTSGAIFGLLVLAHVARVFAEGLRIAMDPWFASATLIAAALCGWAIGLLRITKS